MGVNVLRVCKGFYVYQGCVSSAVALYILGISEMYEVEGVELYWTWIGKLMAVVC